MPILTNLARGEAVFDQNTFYDTSTVTVDIPAIKVDKTSNAVDGVWIGDELTYTITLSNLDPTLPGSAVKFSDVIDPDLAVLVLDSVVVDNVELVAGEDFSYNTTDGTLTIPYGTYTMPEIPVGGSYTITFRVTKA